MPEKMMPGPVDDPRGIREAVCIHTKKIMDQAREEDCADSELYLKKNLGALWRWKSREALFFCAWCNQCEK